MTLSSGNCTHPNPPLQGIERFYYSAVSRVVKIGALSRIINYDPDIFVDIDVKADG